MLHLRTRRARQLRRRATNAEKHLWNALRQNASFWKFRRQHPIGSHVVDFACPACKLAIELDGGQHASKTRLDDERTKQIERHGYHVIRFWNHDVLGNIDGVLETIVHELQKRPASPARFARTFNSQSELNHP